MTFTPLPRPASQASKGHAWLARPWLATAWTLVAAFGAYACMYGFRKPFAAGTFSSTAFGPALKTWLVTAQVLGYTAAKLLGIKVISELPPNRRALLFLGLIGFAEFGLLLFAVTPPPYNIACMALNGLPLGLVFGLVLGFVEGRRLTEFFVAGLCASFIVADGLAKSVGAWLLRIGLDEAIMPCAAGVVFAPPLILFVWMLTLVPPPTEGDVAARSERTPMNAEQRLGMLRRHPISLPAIIVAYLLITVLRGVRADFAPEIWAGLGLHGNAPSFTKPEILVAIGAVTANGFTVLVKNNRHGYLSGLVISIAGVVIATGALLARRHGFLSPFWFMVLLGLGVYLPYVAVHTTIFERLLALTRERGNIGYLIYLADAAGYLGYAGVMLVRSGFPANQGFLPFFLDLSGCLLLAALAALILAVLNHALRPFKHEPEPACSSAPPTEPHPTSSGSNSSPAPNTP